MKRKGIELYLTTIKLSIIKTSMVANKLDLNPTLLCLISSNYSYSIILPCSCCIQELLDNAFSIHQILHPDVFDKYHLFEQTMTSL